MSISKGLLFLMIVFCNNLLYAQNCFPQKLYRIPLFSPFLNTSPKVVGKSSLCTFGDTAYYKKNLLCNGRGYKNCLTDFILPANSPVFAAISGYVHIYTPIGFLENHQTKSALWIESSTLSINYSGLKPVVPDMMYIYKGQLLGYVINNSTDDINFNNFLTFGIRNAKPENPVTKRSFLPITEDASTNCFCKYEPIFPEYFINPENKQIDYSEFNEVIPQGELMVTMQPSGTGNWSFDNGVTWHNSGTKISGLPYIHYTIVFKNEFGYEPPKPISYNLSPSNKVVFLQAHYIADYSILAKPPALVQNEKILKDVSKKIKDEKDSISIKLQSSIIKSIIDSINLAKTTSNNNILDSINFKYSQIEKIQTKQLALSQLLKYILPILALLLSGLGIFYFQNKKISK